MTVYARTVEFPNGSGHYTAFFDTGSQRRTRGDDVVLTDAEFTGVLSRLTTEFTDYTVDDRGNYVLDAEVFNDLMHRGGYTVVEDS